MLLVSFHAVYHYQISVMLVKELGQLLVLKDYLYGNKKENENTKTFLCDFCFHNGFILEYLNLG